MAPKKEGFKMRVVLREESRSTKKKRNCNIQKKSKKKGQQKRKMTISGPQPENIAETTNDIEEDLNMIDSIDSETEDIEEQHTMKHQIKLHGC